MIHALDRLQAPQGYRPEKGLCHAPGNALNQRGPGLNSVTAQFVIIREELDNASVPTDSMVKNKYGFV